MVKASVRFVYAFIAVAAAASIPFYPQFAAGALIIVIGAGLAAAFLPGD